MRAGNLVTSVASVAGLLLNVAAAHAQTDGLFVGHHGRGAGKILQRGKHGARP